MLWEFLTTARLTCNLLSTDVNIDTSTFFSHDSTEVIVIHKSSMISITFNPDSSQSSALASWIFSYAHVSSIILFHCITDHETTAAIHACRRYTHLQI
jgi:hypothetical protein